MGDEDQNLRVIGHAKTSFVSKGALYVLTDNTSFESFTFSRSEGMSVAELNYREASRFAHKTQYFIANIIDPSEDKVSYVVAVSTFDDGSYSSQKELVSLTSIISGKGEPSFQLTSKHNDLTLTCFEGF
jgi:Cys-tRNA synthase (O-phospho-L-seryl-tRNA:Cys-tRNA synthase)